MMNKEKLIELLKKTGVKVNECIPEDIHMNDETRICFWEYEWEPLVASNLEYNTKVTYQISIISNKPRNNAILMLKKELEKNGLHPVIQHEKDIESRRWHSYFALEVLENIE